MYNKNTYAHIHAYKLTTYHCFLCKLAIMLFFFHLFIHAGLFKLPLVQVRSLTLDVKAWDHSVLTLFQSLGNAYTNSIWEELLCSRTSFLSGEMPMG